jgi:hypothetical protein
MDCYGLICKTSGEISGEVTYWQSSPHIYRTGAWACAEVLWLINESESMVEQWKQTFRSMNAFSGPLHYPG